MKENKRMAQIFMRSYLYFGFLLVFFFTSCNSKEIKINKNIIPKKTLTCILFDMHMHDGIINANNNQGGSNIFLSQEHYEHQIFNKYGYTDTVFKISLEYYTFHGQMKDIYSEVLDSLNTLKGKLEQERQLKIHAARQKRQNKH